MTESALLQPGLPGLEDAAALLGFGVTLPELDVAALPQSEEYCIVERHGRRRRIGFHEYARIYAIPGLYEHLFHDLLACQSPALLARLLEHEVRRAGLRMEELVVLDVGAGNGLMGACLAEAGARAVVGIDILPEAAQACRRDRAGVYDAYHVADLRCLSGALREELAQWGFNCMTLISALSAGHIPTEAFIAAYDLIATGGFVVQNMRDPSRRAAAGVPDGFTPFVLRALKAGRLEELLRVRYVHRLAVTGQPLHYVGFVSRKRAALSLRQPGPRPARQQSLEL